MLSLNIPEEYGGAAVDSVSAAIAIEEIGWGCGSTALAIAAHNGLGITPIVLFGSEELETEMAAPGRQRTEQAGRPGADRTGSGFRSAGRSYHPCRAHCLHSQGGEYISNLGLKGHYEGTNHHGEKVVLDCVRQLAAGESVDLSPDIQPNYDYFTKGIGYKALE